MHCSSTIVIPGALTSIPLHPRMSEDVLVPRLCKKQKLPLSSICVFLTLHLVCQVNTVNIWSLYSWKESHYRVVKLLSALDVFIFFSFLHHEAV